MVDRNGQDDDRDGMIDQIVQAAEQCFRKYGVHRTRMEDIAQRVGLARPNLYRYIPSKEAVILRVVLKHTEQLDAERRAQIPLKGPVGPIITDSILLGRRLAAADEFERDMMSAQNVDIAASFVAAEHGDLLPRPDYWYPIFDYGKQRGEIRPELSNDMMRRWIGAVTILLLERTELFTDDASVRAYIENFVTPAFLTGDGIARG